MAEDPPDRQFDSECEQLLSQFISRTRAAEVELSPAARSAHWPRWT